MTHSILFVCTGNIFRSMLAEFAVRAQMGRPAAYRVGSAGIIAKPQTIHPIIYTRLIQKGADPSGHAQRLLTQQLAHEADLIIAMSHTHQEFIRQRFGLTVPLFHEVSLGQTTSILDLHEALPDWEQDVEGSRTYLETVTDHIWDTAPAFVTRVPLFLTPAKPSIR
jgi:protein-tyrosine phosphatase